MNRTRAAVPAAIHEGISPLLELQTALRYWWVLVALTALGALVGWAAHLTRPVLYEAITRLPIGIDYVNTGPLTQYEEDVAMEVVGGMLTAPDVIERVVARVNAAGFNATPQELRLMMGLERRLNVWELRIRTTSPEAAQQIANLWMEEAYAVISESYQHALLANSLSRYTRSLESCLARTAASEPADGECSQGSAQEIQAELAQMSGQLYQEHLASRGLFSGLTIGHPEQAALSTEPVRQGRVGYAMGGALIGLVLAVILVETGLVRRFAK